MFEYLPVLISTLFFSLSIVLVRTNTNLVGRYKALTYMYFSLSVCLVLGAIYLRLPFTFPASLILPYLFQVIIGGIAVIAFYKAIEQGKISVISPLSSLYVIIVLVFGTVIFSESISEFHLIGSLLIILASVAVAFSDINKLKLENGVIILLVTIFGWGYYYTFIKTFVSALGFYMAALFLEVGISIFIAVYYLVRRRDISPPSFGDMGHLFLRGFLVFFGVALHSLSVQNIGVALTSGISVSGPILDVILSHLILKEKLDLYKYLAIILMVVGLSIIFILG